MFSLRKERNLNRNVNRKLSNNSIKLLLIKFLWPNNFCSAGTLRLSAYSEKALHEVIQLQLHSHSFHSLVCHSKPLKHSNLTGS